jgi:hypothetical protein
VKPLPGTKRGGTVQILKNIRDTKQRRCHCVLDEQVWNGAEKGWGGEGAMITAGNTQGLKSESGQEVYTSWLLIHKKKHLTRQGHLCVSADMYMPMCMSVCRRALGRDTEWGVYYGGCPAPNLCNL